MKKRPLLVRVFEPKVTKKGLSSLVFLNQKFKIFGTKSEFFPIGKIGIRNVPNFNNFISPKLHIKKKKNWRTFLVHQNPQISGKKWIFFHFPKKNWNFFQISINLFYLSFNLKKRKKKLENLFFRDPQIFGTKVDFFPIGKIGIRNVPNTKKIVFPEF